MSKKDGDGKQESGEALVVGLATATVAEATEPAAEPSTTPLPEAGAAHGTWLVICADSQCSEQGGLHGQIVGQVVG